MGYQKEIFNHFFLMFIIQWIWNKFKTSSELLQYISPESKKYMQLKLLKKLLKMHCVFSFQWTDICFIEGQLLSDKMKYLSFQIK